MYIYTYSAPTFLLNPCFLVELKTSHLWCAWAMGRWDWEIAVAILLQVEMVSVGGTAASHHQEKKDNMKSLTVVDIYDQYYYIYVIIIYYFGLYLLSQFWLLHLDTCRRKANLMLLFFFVNMSNIFFPKTSHHHRNAITPRTLNIFILWIYRLWKFFKFSTQPANQKMPFLLQLGCVNATIKKPQQTWRWC